ncbi:MAG: site-specific recombinase, phage integrase family [uncultured Campylobacterales bacterium]|uniref:Site-specific recombinase, phage integrase family n=1 Tax=uncultured Campylobacterales bacterium TaxID=352960 RepID=A0A6S6SYE1_9BACT|nr:MAG: site-specific recombinase, phage integrase family [uncultured Campylobacterales bacterium]
MKLKTLSKKKSTNENGIFYKEIINENNKVVDKVFIIRYRDNNKDKLVTVGKYSTGIRVAFCKQKRDEILNKIRLGEDIPIKHKNKEKNIVFDEVAKKYLENLILHSTENTIKDITSKYQKHIYPTLGNIEIEAITTRDLEDLQKEKSKTLSPQTVNQTIEMFSTIFNYGLKKEICKTLNPAINVKRFKINNTRERYLTTDEIKELYELLQDNKLLTLFVKIALCTGGRLETILHIQKKDIDLGTQAITLHDLKNKDSYKGFLTNDIIKIIKPLLKKLKSNHYIVSINGIKLTSRQLQSRLKPKLDKLFNKELDLRDAKNRVVIHTLRHTFASHLAINGTPIFTIQKLMNHKDIKQTTRYAKLSPDSGRDFVNNLYNE